MKQLQHTSETIETLKTCICTIGEGSMGQLILAIGGGSRWRAVTRDHHQHLAALVGALVWGGPTLGTHGVRHGPHHQGWSSPKDEDCLRRTTLLSARRKAS
jgi:hypothetical protein